MPKHLVIQADNTTSQCKNGHVAALLSQLVAMRKYATVTMNFLMVGHTHEDVDQMFGLLCPCLSGGSQGGALSWEGL